jgi:hypothetical protein
MTADLAPLLTGMWVILGLCILGITFAIGVHDTWQAQRKVEETTTEPVALPKAA